MAFGEKTIAKLGKLLEGLDRYRDIGVLFLIKGWWPKAITPNHLSWLRVGISALLFALLFIFGTESKGLILWLFVIGALTDMLDGSLARGTNQVTKFGAMLDPSADRLLIIPIAVYSLWKHDPSLLWALVGAELINTAVSIFHKSKEIYMESNIFGKTKMVLQAVALIIILLVWPHHPGGIAIGLLWVSFLLTFMSIFARLDEMKEKGLIGNRNA